MTLITGPSKTAKRRAWRRSWAAILSIFLRKYAPQNAVCDASTWLLDSMMLNIGWTGQYRKLLIVGLDIWGPYGKLFTGAAGEYAGKTYLARSKRANASLNIVTTITKLAGPNIMIRGSSTDRCYKKPPPRDSVSPRMKNKLTAALLLI